MRKRKRRFALYTFFDRAGISAHLQKMAERGWLIEKIDSPVWVYRRIEPKKLTFCVTYCPGASAFDPEPSEGQSVFCDLCAHTGWVLAASAAQMQVFYSQRENPVPIETDPVVEVETIHRSKGTFLFSHIALAVLALLNGGLLWGQLRDNPAQALSRSSGLFSGFCWLCVLVLCAAEVVGYYLWHRRAVKAAEQGVFLPRRSSHFFQCAVLAGVLTALALYGAEVLRTGTFPEKAALAAALPGYFLMVALIRLARDALRRRKVSRGVNLGITLALCLVLTVLLLGTVSAGILWASRQGRPAGADTYEYEGHIFTACHDVLPLTVEDLLGTACGGYSRRMQSRGSFLTEWQEAVQKPRLDAADFQEMPYLSYAVAVVKVPALYGFCRDGMLRQRDEVNVDRGVPAGYREQYQAADPGPWRAREAYRLVREDTGPEDRYLLCYGDRIVEICFDWEPTEEQMALVGERLGLQG